MIVVQMALGIVLAYLSRLMFSGAPGYMAAVAIIVFVPPLVSVPWAIAIGSPVVYFVALIAWLMWIFIKTRNL